MENQMVEGNEKIHHFQSEQREGERERIKN